MRRLGIFSSLFEIQRQIKQFFFLNNEKKFYSLDIFNTAYNFNNNNNYFSDTLLSCVKLLR
jgi:hypothetical protein